MFATNPVGKPPQTSNLNKNQIHVTYFLIDCGFYWADSPPGVPCGPGSSHPSFYSLNFKMYCKTKKAEVSKKASRKKKSLLTITCGGLPTGFVANTKIC